MRVRDLIERLQQFSPDADVWLRYDEKGWYDYDPIETVERRYISYADHPVVVLR